MVINYKDICHHIFSRKEFVEDSLLGIGILQDGKIKYANKTLLNLFEFRFEEIQGQNFWMTVIHPEDIPKVMQKINMKLSDGNFNTTRYKCRIILKSKQIRHIQVFSKVIYYGNRVAILFTVIEIPQIPPLIEMSTYDKAKLSIIENLLKQFNIPYKISVPSEEEKSMEC